MRRQNKTILSPMDVRDSPKIAVKLKNEHSFIVLLSLWEDQRKVSVLRQIKRFGKYLRVIIESERTDGMFSSRILYFTNPGSPFLRFEYDGLEDSIGLRIDSKPLKRHSSSSHPNRGETLYLLSHLTEQTKSFY